MYAKLLLSLWLWIAVTAYLIPATASASSDVSVIPDVIYDTPAGPLKMDIYLPRTNQNQRVPCLVWIPASEKADSLSRSVCAEIASAGYMAVNIQYEPSRENSGQGNSPSAGAVIAAKCAIRFLRTSAEKYPLDERRIGVGGSSMGGAIALLVGFTTQEAQFAVQDFYPNVTDRVSLVISFAGPTEWLKVPPGVPPGKHKKEIEQMLTRLSPLTYVRPNVPPVLMIHGTADKRVPYDQSVELNKQLAKSGVPHRLELLDRVGHVFNLTTANGRPLPNDVKGIVLDFFKIHFATP